MYQADKGVLESDVRAAYRLFLGREPESANAVAEKLGLTLGALVAELLTSDEFQTYVFKPLVSARPEDEGRFSAPPSPGVRTWSAATFGLDLDLLREASDWGLVLLHVLAVGDKRDDVPGLALSDEERASVLRALSLRQRSAQYSGLIGAIEALDDESVEGWAVDRKEPDRPIVLNILIDDDVAAIAKPDRFRRDLQDAYGGNGTFGFRAVLPALSADKQISARAVRVELREQASERLLAARTLARDPQPKLDDLTRIGDLLESIKKQLMTIEEQLPAARATASFSIRSYDAYRRSYGSPQHSLETQRIEARNLPIKPRFHIDCAGRSGAGRQAFATTEASLGAQTYEDWCWAEADGDPGPRDYLVLIAAGDELEPDALFQLARAIGAGSRPKLLTVDDDRVETDGEGRRSFASPRLRGAHDPWRLLQQIEPDALLAVEAQLARECGARADQRRAALSLELALAAGRHGVRHVPRILHHRGGAETDTSRWTEGFRPAVVEALSRAGVRADVDLHRDTLGAAVPGALGIVPRGEQARLASVIIPTRDRIDLLRPCVEGLLGTRINNLTPFELLILDNGGDDPKSSRYIKELEERGEARRLHDPRPFNWSALNNRAAAAANGDVFIFLNDDTTIVASSWCDELCLWATWPGAGVAGARLIYGDGTLQHAGVVTGVFGVAAHEGVGDAGHDPGYLGRHALAHRTSAVSGACMAVRRDCFEALGGFDEQFAIAYNDVDFCLRADTAGWAVLYAPQAVFHHFESKTRRFDRNLEGGERADWLASVARVRSIWGDRLTNDPYYNPHFERWAPPFTRLGAIDPRMDCKYNA